MTRIDSSKSPSTGSTWMQPCRSAWCHSILYIIQGKRLKHVHRYFSYNIWYNFEHFTNATTAIEIAVFVKTLSRTPCPSPIAAIPTTIAEEAMMSLCQTVAEYGVTIEDINNAYVSLNKDKQQCTHSRFSALAVTKFGVLFLLGMVGTWAYHLSPISIRVS